MGGVGLDIKVKAETGNQPRTKAGTGGYVVFSFTVSVSPLCLVLGRLPTHATT
jgi:hypothetical protein